jgi:hypothetical protein
VTEAEELVVDAALLVADAWLSPDDPDDPANVKMGTERMGYLVAAVGLLMIERSALRVVH